MDIPDLDWQHWFKRWEAMQSCYVPQRLQRFDLMLKQADLPQNGDVHILDLCCGPGSLAFRALRHYPDASVVAVDCDPVLLAVGQGVARELEEIADQIRFVQADIRNADWWAPYEAAFDLILSSIALHWLSAENLAQTYRQVFRALKPGGWSMNSDHVASDDPATQARYRERLHARQQQAFGKREVDDWNSFWRSLDCALEETDLAALRNEAQLWEGTDDGRPRQLHIATLEACGFERVEFSWEYLGEAVIGARKPA